MKHKKHPGLSISFDKIEVDLGLFWIINDCIHSTINNENWTCIKHSIRDIQLHSVQLQPHNFLKLLKCLNVTK